MRLSAHSSSRQRACAGRLLGSCVCVVFMSVLKCMRKVASIVWAHTLVAAMCLVTSAAVALGVLMLGSLESDSSRKLLALLGPGPIPSIHVSNSFPLVHWTSDFLPRIMLLVTDCWDPNA